MIKFLIGFFIGSWVGVCLMCLVIMGRDKE